MKISILGTGRVAQALAQGFARNKHEVTFGSRDPAKVTALPGTRVTSQREAVRSGEVIVLAVPYSAHSDVANSVGPSEFKGKTVVDVSNVRTASSEWAVGFTTSAAEEIAKLLPDARVVKAFNTTFAQHMPTGKIGNEKLSLFVAADDKDAKETVMRLGGEIGFEPVDAGPLRSARYLEPMALLNINLAFVQKMGPGIGFRVVRASQ